MTKNLDKLIQEVFDPNRVILHCEEHLYMAKDLYTQPKHSCKKCWMAYFILLLGKSHPDNREEKSLLLEEIVHKMKEQIDRGEDPGRLTGRTLIIDPKKAN